MRPASRQEDCGQSSEPRVSLHGQLGRHSPTPGARWPRRQRLRLTVWRLRVRDQGYAGSLLVTAVFLADLTVSCDHSWGGRQRQEATSPSSCPRKATRPVGSGPHTTSSTLSSLPGPCLFTRSCFVGTSEGESSPWRAHSQWTLAGGPSGFLTPVSLQSPVLCPCLNIATLIAGD